MTAVLTACALVAGARPVHGQAGFRQTVVVTAAATPVEVGSVTRTITVVTRQQIDELPASTVADVLRLVASVDVRARGTHGVQTDFAVRGATFGQVLVLVDGVRLNDAQSGHHNGDIPVPLDAVERIEILHGPGSSLFGADAFGGTINIITRPSGGGASATLEGGSFGLVAGRGQIAFDRGTVRQMFSGSADRSDGFMFERGFDTSGFSSKTVLAERTDLSLSYVRKDFGANQFYGNAPSHEWTNQTLLVVEHRLPARSGWEVSGTASYRTHGDRFLFNVLTPGLFENRHRSHAVIGSLRASRRIGSGGSLAAGLEGGGDWIRSTNLGDHSTGRASGFGEWRQALGGQVTVDAGLRVDRYGEFGTSWSPSAGAGWWLLPSVRVRGSVARAFRVPTFTERFYRDPAHQARADVHAETAWAGEAGADLYLSGGWALSGTVFGRLDHDVIDWLRPTTADLWRTYNIRSVDTVGVEVGLSRTLSGGAFLQVQYTGLDVRPEAVDQLSKYVLDYAPHTLTAAALVALPGDVHLSPRLVLKRRRLSSGRDDYALFDARVSRRVGPVDVFLDGTNLFNASYQEVANVPMPGRAASVGATLRSR